MAASDNACVAIPTSDMPGHRSLHDRVVGALETCVESRGVEFKESAAWDSLQFKIIRTALAMANLRDGGIVVIGVGERDEQWNLSGISDDHFATYDVDVVSDAIHKYASPSVTSTMVSVAHNERRFLALQILEFTDMPIVCRRDWGTGPTRFLRQGAVYVRPEGSAKTNEVRTAEDMRELLDLAVDKRVKDFLERSRRLGLESPPPQRSFDEELGGL
jgi:predicted HTH transcriptional regulator